MATAAKLEGVTILESKPERESFKLRVRAKDGPMNSYFFVNITKGDPQAFEKLLKVVTKSMKRNKFQLDLDIPSFSISSNGSYYKSDDITFGLRER